WRGGDTRGVDAARAVGRHSLMRIEHLALWTRDPKAMRAFYVRWFGARANARDASARRAGVASHVLAFCGGGARP
ncbi:MAG: hypothetical protein MUE41_01695, partial [Gemmatimonadaceae bacterium]|nr:hypothetical protein [Gemmatimonadaceae bacterium]